MVPISDSRVCVRNLRTGLDPERTSRAAPALLHHRLEGDRAREVHDVEWSAGEPLPPDPVADAVGLAVIRAAVTPGAQVRTALRLHPLRGGAVQVGVLGVVERERARQRRQRTHAVEHEGVVDGQHRARVRQRRHDRGVRALDAGEELEADDPEAVAVLRDLVEVPSREEGEVDREVDRRVRLSGGDELGHEVEVVERMAAVVAQHRGHATHDRGAALRPELARVRRAVPDVDVRIDHPGHHQAVAGVDHVGG
ncbi:MAG TPA: hypothetical protein VEL05_10475, partial [Candidatus Acidoferrum sp.]|nr:hypothetical protein [Candidatus Acidoferrum sp.]